MDESNSAKQENEDVVQAFIQASREEAERQMEKEALRRRGFRIAMVLAAAALVLATYALLSRQAAVAQMEQAEQRRAQAEKLIGFMLNDMKNKLGSVSRLDMLEDIGREAMDYFETLPKHQLTGDSRLNQIKALHSIGEALLKQDKMQAALEIFNQALVRAETLAARDANNSDWQYELVVNYYWMIMLNKAEHNDRESMVYCEKYLDVARRMNAVQPENETWLYELSAAYHNMTAINSELRETDQALEYAAKNLEILETLCQKNPDNHGYQKDLADALSWRGRLLYEQGRAREAEPSFIQALKTMELVIENDPINLSSSEFIQELHRHLFNTYLYVGDDKEAWFHVKAALEISWKLVKADPENRDRKYRLGLTLLSQGILLVDAEAWEQAESCFEQIRALQMEPEGMEQLSRWLLLEIRVQNERARMFLTRNAPKKALAVLNWSPDIDKDAAKSIFPRVKSLKYQGKAHTALGDRSAARKLWEEALLICETNENQLPGLRAEMALLLLYLERKNDAQILIDSLNKEGFTRASFRKELRQASR